MTTVDLFLQMESEVEIPMLDPYLHPRCVPTLHALAMRVYLRFLEDEVASFIALVHLDSPIWNPIKDRILAALKAHIDRHVFGYRSSQIRRDLLTEILSGRSIPNAHNRNAHLCVDTLRTHSPLDDDDETTQGIEKIKQYGRECSSPCCTGAFIIEVMMAVILNEDVESIVFPENLKATIYKKKPIRSFLFFDMPSVMVHYIQRLDQARKPPALRRLAFFDFNLGTIDGQLVHERILKAFSETKLYYNFPWKFSGKLSRASTDFMMLTLSKLFSRPKNYFRHLTSIRLSSECINVRLNMYGDRGGPAAIQLMAGIAYSCPVLETLDLSSVASLSPECLVYLFFQDTFSTLHKYMYLPSFLVSKSGSVYHDPEWGRESMRKHDGVRYCPWCDDPATKNMVRKGCEFDVSESLFVIDDRLYNYIEYVRGDETMDANSSLLRASHFLLYCVKASELVRGLTDDAFQLTRPVEEIPVRANSPANPESTPSVDSSEDDSSEDEAVTFPEVGAKCEYQRKSHGENGTKSALCSTLKALTLPMDIVDSKKWVIPLILRAVPQLKSLGDCSVYDGLRVAQSLGISITEEDSQQLNLEEISLSFEDATLYRVRESMVRCVKSLISKHPHWSNFVSVSNNPFSMTNWIENDTDEVLGFQEFLEIKQRWWEQVKTVVATAPKLRKIKLSVQSAILLNQDRYIWEDLLHLDHLRELHIYSSSWTDTLGILELLGHKIEILNLMLNTPTSLIDESISSMEYINTVPYLCPNLQEVHLGHIPGDYPHSLCSSPLYDSEASYQFLSVFEASGNMTLDAFQFLWTRAKLIQSVKIAGKIVVSTATSGRSYEAVTFTKDRIEHLFNLNPMFGLQVLDVPMVFSSIDSAQLFLDNLPMDMNLISNLTVKVNIPESLEGETLGEVVSTVLGRMAAFKRDCGLRRGEVVWNWKREGILTILLQQQMMLPVSELVDP